MVMIVMAMVIVMVMVVVVVVVMVMVMVIIITGEPVPLRLIANATYVFAVQTAALRLLMTTSASPAPPGWPGWATAKETSCSGFWTPQQSQRSFSVSVRTIH